MCRVVDPLVDESCLYPQTEKIAVKGISKVLKEVREWVKKKNEKGKEDVTSEGVEESTENGGVGQLDLSPTSNHVSTQETQGSTIGVVPTPPSVAKPSEPSHSILKDPPILKKRGRPKSTRFKGIEECGWKNPNTGKKKKSKKEVVQAALNQMNSSLKVRPTVVFYFVYINGKRYFHE